MNKQRREQHERKKLCPGNGEMDGQGNWIFTSAEIAEAFPVAESSVIEMFGAILTEVYQHEAVAEANVNFESDGSATFDLTFYTNYCPNISDETKAG